MLKGRKEEGVEEEEEEEEINLIKFIYLKRKCLWRF